jgi:hypothetical protein
MIGILQAVEQRGAKAVRRLLLATAGAGLLALSAGFAGAALADVLALQMPRYAALGAVAATLLIGGIVVLASARERKASPAPAEDADRLAARSSAAATDWRTALQLALVEDAQDRPARAAALAALAGLILGAMEGLRQPQGAKSE